MRKTFLLYVTIMIIFSLTFTTYTNVNFNYEYYVELPKNENSKNKSIEIADSDYVELFFDDFESGAPGWTHGGTYDKWELGTPVNGPGSAYSGSNCYATDLDGNYANNADNYLVSPTIFLSGSEIYLEFYHWYSIEQGYDAGWVEISTDDGATWQKITPISGPAYSSTSFGTAFSGSSGGWVKSVFDLSDYADHEIKIRFHFKSDWSVTYNGWYIDDVKIIAKGIVIDILKPQSDVVKNQSVDLEFILRRSSSDIEKPNFIEVYVNDTLHTNLTSVSFDTKYGMNLNLFDEGYYEIKIAACYNRTYNITRTKIVYADGTPPEIHHSYSDGDLFMSLNATFDASFTDNYRLNSTIIYLNDTEYYQKSFDSDSDDVSFDFTLDKSGRYRLKIRIIDAAGWITDEELTVFIDVNAPDVLLDVIQSPFKNRTTWYINTTTFTFKLNISDDYRPEDTIVKVYVNDNLTYDLNGTLNTVLNAYINDTYANITIQTVDWAGNEYVVTHLVYYDPEPPAISITTPENGSEIRTGGTTIVWAFGDNMHIEKVEIYVNNTLVKVLPPETRSWYFKPGANGIYIIKIVVYDGAGNKASAEITLKFNATEYQPIFAKEIPIWQKYLPYILIGSIIIVGVVIATILMRKKGIKLSSREEKTEEEDELKKLLKDL